MFPIIHNDALFVVDKKRVEWNQNVLTYSLTKLLVNCRAWTLHFWLVFLPNNASKMTCMPRIVLIPLPRLLSRYCRSFWRTRALHGVVFRSAIFDELPRNRVYNGAVTSGWVQSTVLFILPSSEMAGVATLNRVSADAKINSVSISRSQKIPLHKSRQMPFFKFSNSSAFHALAMTRLKLYPLIPAGISTPAVTLQLLTTGKMLSVGKFLILAW